MGIKTETLKRLFKKPVTEEYPKQKKQPFDKFIGRIVYHSETCIGCRLCEKNCPANAITFNKKGDITFDMGKCIYCGMCRDVCPTNPKTIEYITEYDYSSTKKEALTNKKK